MRDLPVESLGILEVARIAAPEDLLRRLQSVRVPYEKRRERALVEEIHHTDLEAAVLQAEEE